MPSCESLGILRLIEHLRRGAWRLKLCAMLRTVAASRKLGQTHKVSVKTHRSGSSLAVTLR
jgi:hypothetical protein